MGMSDWFERFFDTSDPDSMAYAFNIILKSFDEDFEMLKEDFRTNFKNTNKQNGAKTVDEQNAQEAMELRNQYNTHLMSCLESQRQLLERKTKVICLLTGKTVSPKTIADPKAIPYVFMKFGDLLPTADEERTMVSEAYQSPPTCQIARLGMFERRLNELDAQFEKERQVLSHLEQKLSVLSTQQTHKLTELLQQSVSVPCYDARGTMTLEYQTCTKHIEDMVVDDRHLGKGVYEPKEN